MANENPNHERQRLKLAVELGAGAAGIGLGAAALVLWRRHQAESTEGEKKRFEPRAAILTHESLKPKHRQRVVEAAARIYLATVENDDLVITRHALEEQMEISRAGLNRALGHLSDSPYQLIKRRYGTRANPALRGYVATDALVWAAEEGDYPELRTAIEEVILERSETGSTDNS